MRKSPSQHRVNVGWSRDLPPFTHVIIKHFGLSKSVKKYYTQFTAGKIVKQKTESTRIKTTKSKNNCAKLTAAFVQQQLTINCQQFRAAKMLFSLKCESLEKRS